MADISEIAETARGEKIWIGHYVVLFLDVLDQREAIRRLEKLPSGENERADYILALKNSKGKVEDLRKILNQFYAGYQNTPSEVPLEKLNTEQRAALQAWNDGKPSLSFQSFADTIVAFAPVIPSSGLMRVDGVYAVLAAAGSVLMTCLAAGVPVRGGLDMNVALVLGQNDLYGPAALEAFRLECEVAQFPRVAVGKNVLEFLHAVLASAKNDPLAKRNAELANVCLNLLAVAADSVPFVNFLGANFRKMLGDTGNDLFLKGQDFVRQEHEKFFA